MSKVNLGELIARAAVSNLDTENREQIEYIDIDLIDDDPRNFYVLSDLEELAANIELCGLQQPIRVRQGKGDHVVIDDTGALTINDEPYEEPYVKFISRQSGEFQVPEGCYLFFGDNRSGSLDARNWEQPYIPAEKITGKAIFTLWPFENFGVLKWPF